MFEAFWAWLAGVIVAMFAFALKQARRLDLNEAELDNANKHIWTFSILGVSGILSIVIAATVPGEWVGLAGYQYFLLFLLFLVKRFKKLSLARPAKLRRWSRPKRLGRDVQEFAGKR